MEVHSQVGSSLFEWTHTWITQHEDADIDVNDDDAVDDDVTERLGNRQKRVYRTLINYLQLYPCAQ
jgi:hypothetical protein